MLRYETLILARTQITADEFSMIENYFENLASDAKGKVVAFDKWGKYRLAYPIKKNDYGVYFLVRFEFLEGYATSVFKNLTDFFKIKCNEVVMRYVTNKIDSSSSLVYKYPDSIDGGKSGNLDTFLKENKMESFLDNIDTSNKKAGEKTGGVEPIVNTQTEAKSTEEKPIPTEEIPTEEIKKVDNESDAPKEEN